MGFSRGDEVVVRSLNRRGRIVEARGGRYRVAIGALTIAAEEDDLRAAESGKKRARKVRAGAPTAAVSRADSDEEKTHRVDLHGLTTDAAREAVIAAVNAAVLDGASTVEIVHGIGTGRVRDAAWQELKRLSVVRHVRPHPTNRGMTIVHL